MRRLLLVLAAALLPACSCSYENNSELFQRMMVQPKALPYSTSAVFEDGRAMRMPIAGTVPREKLATLGRIREFQTEGGGYVTQLPVRLSRELLARGRGRFDIFCAPCHGVLGNGESIVARNMSLVVPPSLHARPDRPEGWLYQVVTQGHGLMPGYGNQLTVEDRWAVVAYIRALQLSQRAPLAGVPAAERQKLVEAAQ